MRVVQAFTRERERGARTSARLERELPRGEHADRRLERALLPLRRPALAAPARDRARLRRLARLPRAGDDRDAVRLHLLPDELLRPDPAALAALQHLPLGHGGAGQDHGRARRGARGARHAGRARAGTGRPATSASTTSASATGPSCPRCCTVSISTCRPERPSRSSATPAPASRRSRSCSRASTTRARAGSRSTAPTCATSSSTRSARSSGSCRRRASCSPARSRENIAFGRPDATDRQIVAAARAVGAHDFIDAARERLRHRARRARLPALARPAPARRLRAGAARRPAHPDPRRGDLLGRHRHRAHDRAGAQRAPGRPHGVRHRPPPLDDPRRRPDRRARARPRRRAGHARRAAGAAGVLHLALHRSGAGDRVAPALRHAAITSSRHGGRKSFRAPAQVDRGEDG